MCRTALLSVVHVVPFATKREREKEREKERARERQRQRERERERLIKLFLNGKDITTQTDWHICTASVLLLREKSRVEDIRGINVHKRAKQHITDSDWKKRSNEAEKNRKMRV